MASLNSNSGLDATDTSRNHDLAPKSHKTISPESGAAQNQKRGGMPKTPPRDPNGIEPFTREWVALPTSPEKLGPFLVRNREYLRSYTPEETYTELRRYLRPADLTTSSPALQRFLRASEDVALKTVREQHGANWNPADGDWLLSLRSRAVMKTLAEYLALDPLVDPNEAPDSFKRLVDRFIPSTMNPASEHYALHSGLWFESTSLIFEGVASPNDHALGYLVTAHAAALKKQDAALRELDVSEALAAKASIVHTEITRCRELGEQIGRGL